MMHDYQMNNIMMKLLIVGGISIGMYYTIGSNGVTIMFLTIFAVQVLNIKA